MSGRQQLCSVHEKTYVWVKLRGDGTSCISPSQGSINSSKNGYRRLRTSSTAKNDALDSLWRWTPGYYTCSSPTATTPQQLREDPVSFTSTDASSSASVSCAPSIEYHFTLLEQSVDLNHERHPTLAENILSQHLENGDIVLANAWEIHDFIHRFEMGDVDCDDDDNANNYLVGDHIHSVVDSTPTQPPHNLIELTHLHEPSVVNALRHRYYQRMQGDQRHDIHNVYTETGSILLAVNPFQIAHDDDDDHDYEDSTCIRNIRSKSTSTKRMSLYGENTMQCYKVDGEKRWINEMTRAKHGAEDSDDTNNSSSTLPPHVYAVADRTFRTMLTRVQHKSTSSARAGGNHRGGMSPAATGKQNESVDADNEKINQSILVSGESGAGKTVTTKLLMAYLSKLSKGGAGGPMQDTDSSHPNGVGMTIEQRILESNPILESFGNARTVRNDNSSRFGKYIEMEFLSSVSMPSSSSSGVIIPDASLVGASIETYLLEKVRLVHQSPGERNYHIFYELLSMKYADEASDYDIAVEEGKEGCVEEAAVSLTELGLLDYDMEDFRMLNNSDTYDRRDGVSDQQTFWATKRAMSILGFTTSDVSNVLQVVASLLHASNLTFVQKSSSVELSVDDECELDEENPHLEHVVKLLGITVEAFNSAVCYHEITIGGDGNSGPGVGRGHNSKGGSEIHKRLLTKEQAAKGVEALTKATYGAVFEYLVRRINSSVATSNKSSPNRTAPGRRQAVGRDRLAKESSIGILDIFGFESFQSNSFEQLCINYCNEALQQQFNRFVLKREQEEYDIEGIPWSFIEYPENQDVLDLIDSKVSGILSILHDQCRTPRATDRSFAMCMYEKCSSYTRFEADSRQTAEQLFAVHHYAGVVEYNVEGFVEKNKDELPKNALILLQSSSNDFVRTLAQILVPSSEALSLLPSPSTKVKKPGVTQRPTVGIQFSSQLHDLRNKIDDTSPHYIRCLKPNTLFTPDHFDEALVSNQLRCAGVIEAVQVSRLGYPHRFYHRQFVARYHILGGISTNSKKKNNTATALVQSIKANQKSNHLDVGVQVGKSRVFLRHRAHEMLEQLRRVKIVSAAVTVQQHTRRYLCQQQKAKALCSLLKMQSFIRKALAVIVVAKMKRRRSSIIIQMHWRKYSARKYILSSIFISIWCQSHFRGIVDRKVFQILKRDENASYIQSLWRRQRAMVRYQEQRKAAILIQCALRCRTARFELVARKAESRNLSMLIQERDRLREEVLVLRNELHMIKCANQANHVIPSDDAISNTTNTQVSSLRLALGQATRDREHAAYELELAKTKIAELESERDVAIRNREEMQSELKRDAMDTLDYTDITEVLSLRAALDKLQDEKELAESKLEQANNEILTLKSESGTGDRCANQTDTDVTENVFLRTALEQLAKEKELAETNLAHAATEILALKSERDVVVLDRDDLRQVNKIIQSELASREEELRRAKESLDELKRQNIAITSSKFIGPDPLQNVDKQFRAHEAAGDIHVDHGYNVPITKSSVAEYSLAGNTVLEWEDESRIIRLEDYNVDTNRNRRQSMYELDDMKRVNRSLREDLEAITAEKNAMAKELKVKCDEFDELNDDVEKFAEAFAAQNSELQKLRYENKKLRASASTTAERDRI